MPYPNILSLLPTYCALYRDVQRQKRFVQAELEPEIARAMSANDGTLDEEDFQKIRSYYGFGVPAIVGEGVCTLHGRKMSLQERKASTYQGALTGLYDDFFDKTRIPHEEIQKMMMEAGAYEARSSLEKLFIRFLNNVHLNINDKTHFSDTFHRVYKAQIETQNQLDPDLSWDETKEITFRKGGLSLLFYRSIFEDKLKNGEEEALYHSGALMQLGNDIFDVYKDHKENIRTLPATCRNIDDVRKVFESQLARTLIMIDKSDFPLKNKRMFINKLLLGISRCYVCLDQLERLEKRTDGIFRPSAYARNDMICDMEKPVNMLRSIRYFLTYKL